MTYIILTNSLGDKCIKKDNQIVIPFADDNSDYQAYLVWVADGNTAEEWTGN
jgi:hypothetical protein